MTKEDFSFMRDDRLRQIVLRDYEELQQLDARNAAKAVIVLSGGIVEGLLFDALVASKKWTFEKACENFLKDMIGPAQNLGIITEDRLTQAVRKYRNLIHPGREIREKMVFSETDAALSRLAVDIVVREVRTWFQSEEQIKRLTKILSTLNKDQQELLMLFSTGKPVSSNQYDHPRLKHDVYAASFSMIKNGILLKEADEQLSEYQEKITICPDVIELVETIVIKSEIQRKTIILDLHNIEASCQGGSGAGSGIIHRR